MFQNHPKLDPIDEEEGFLLEKEEDTSRRDDDNSSSTNGDDAPVLDEHSHPSLQHSVTTKRQSFDMKDNLGRIKVYSSVRIRTPAIVVYVVSWVSFYLLVYYHRRGRYTDDHHVNSAGKDNEITVDSTSKEENFMDEMHPSAYILCAEIIKMSVSIGLMLKQGGANSLVVSLLQQPCNLKIVALRNLPLALLYTMYNNFMFINLKNNQPTMYLVLASSRLIMKSIVWQIQFKLNISTVKQISLVLITLGIMSRCFGSNTAGDILTAERYLMSGGNEQCSTENGSNAAAIVLQMMCSVMASVYYQHIGEYKSSSENEHLDSIGLYINSITMNMIINAFMVIGSRSSGSSRDAFMKCFEWKQWISSLDTLAIILSLAAGGIMSLKVMRHETSITKGIVTATEMIMVTIIQYVWFEDKFSLTDLMGVVLVISGVMLYRMPRNFSIQWGGGIFAKCSSMQLLISGCSWFFLTCCLFVARNGIDGGIDKWSSSFHTQIHLMHISDMSSSARGSGLVACISLREHVAEALVLASSIDELNQNATSITSLEIYHNVSLSYYLTAKLEANKGVSVIDLSSSSSQSPCLIEAMTTTSLKDILLVDTSIVLLLGHSPLINVDTHPKDGIKICGNGKHRSKDVGTVTSTSIELDESLHLLKNHYALDSDEPSQKFCKAYLCGNKTADDDDNYVFIGNNITDHSVSLLVGSIFNGVELKRFPFWQSHVHAYMYPVWNDFDRINYFYDSSLFCGSSSSLSKVCDENISMQIKQNWFKYRDAYTTLLLDRPLSWVAFDGGIAPWVGNSSCASFNSVNGAKNSVIAGGGSRRTALNIDLVRISDGSNIAMHSEVAYGPINFEANTPRHSYHVRSMTRSQAYQLLRNPCLPVSATQTWLDHNEYRLHQLYDTIHTNDFFQAVDVVEDFLDKVILQDGAEVIFDLKSPNGTDQLQQAQHIYSLIQQKTDTEKEILLDKVALRFFDVGLMGDINLGILPKFVQESIISGTFTSQLKTYFNAPSKQACSVLEKYANQHNVNFAGCFIVEDDGSILKVWQELSTTFLNSSKLTISLHDKAKVICDVPRKQDYPDTTLWSHGLSACVENGYEWIHHPFPVSSSSSPLSNFDMPPSFLSKTNLINQSLIENHLTETKSNLQLKAVKLAPLKKALSKWDKYRSHWAVTSAFDWRTMDHKQWSFSGNNQISATTQTQNNKLIFRCVTKILTVMLFLRLEQDNILSIDDFILGIPYNVTWKQVFSNTAGKEGKKAGKEFVYSNELWIHVPDAIQNATGLSFEETMQYYILDPMGLSGSFDNQTKFPPIAARGYVGSLQDLIIIGCTLTTGGISPKTKKRVLSTNNVQTMLKDWTTEQGMMHLFRKNYIVLFLRRWFNTGTGNSSTSAAARTMFFLNTTNTTNTTTVIDDTNTIMAYGMGMWLVNGWRTKKGPQGESVPVQGWLALGGNEAALYFDADGLVVGMLAPESVLFLELEGPFFNFVRQVGSIMEDSLQQQQESRQRL